MNRLLLVVALFMVPFGIAAATDCAKAVPADLVAQLAEAHPSFRALEITDLRSDDQGIWRSAHPEECPGSASLHFFNAKSTDYAVLLVRPESPDMASKVVIASAAPGGRYRLLTIRSEDSTAALPVIHNGGPGRYEDATKAGRSYRTRRDALIVEHLESAATAYLVHNGEVVSVLLSE